jgi:Dehydratase family
MTKRAFENAITIVMVLGGSTNAVLHLIAMARAVDVDITLDDFQRISDKTPLLADLKPSGKSETTSNETSTHTQSTLQFILISSRLFFASSYLQIREVRHGRHSKVRRHPCSDEVHA